MNKQYDVVVVGAGLFGLTIAERCAVHGMSVLLLDKRDHLGGNAYSEFDPETHIEIHKYGAHLFHTDNEKVWEYVNNFTSFTDYRHRVMAESDNHVYPLPFNLGLINQFYGTAMSPDEAKAMVAQMVKQTGVSGNPKNLEEKAISLIGRDLYEEFVKDYTAKQWQTDPTELDASIINRIPVRYNYDTRYFTDKYQGQPKDGYEVWFKNMIHANGYGHNIDVILGVDWNPRGVRGSKFTVYTGPIDRYFDYVHGALPWRTVDFDFERHDGDYQGVSVMNSCDAGIPWTRTIEFQHFHPERVRQTPKTIIAREYSRFADKDDEPYYPIPSAESREQIKKYRALTSAEPVLFGGRLATYQYLDMHMAIASALAMFERMQERS